MKLIKFKIFEFRNNKNEIYYRIIKLIQLGNTRHHPTKNATRT